MAKKTPRYNISVTNQLIALSDVENKTDRFIKTQELITAMTHSNVLYKTDLIDPGLKYLSVDYAVGNMIRCDVAFEIPPAVQDLGQGSMLLSPWITVLFTVQAPVTNYKKASVVEGSFHVFISEHQIYNALTEIHVPTFVSTINERGAIESAEFYEAINEYGFYTPFAMSGIFQIIRTAFLTHAPVDTSHVDFVKLAENTLANGYDRTWTPRQAGEAKFSFDFSFLPAYEFGEFIKSFGKNSFKRVTPRSLFDFFNVNE